MTWRIGGVIVLLGLLYALSQVVWRAVAPHPGPAVLAQERPVLLRPRVTPGGAPAALMPPVEIRPPAPCAVSPAFAQAAQLNAASLSASAWAVFGRAEAGWETYAPLAAHEIGTACPGDADGFAQALSTWQAAHGLAASGVMDEGALDALRLVWLRRRPFVAATPGGNCPPPPAPDQLVWAKADEGYQTKPIQLRPEALEAWRALVGAARAQLPELAADHRLLTIFSGFRDPAENAARCAEAGDCGPVARARCSAHGTGLALDLFLGAAPGYPPESSADPNRLYQSRSAAYRWLVVNAERFGFRPYPFEPWHWEWTGTPAT